MFKAVHYTDVISEKVEGEGYKGVTVKWLITKDDGAENFAMRYFEIEPRGQTSFHSHNWEHEVFILNGKCSVIYGNSKREVTQGYAIIIPPNEKHCFRNSGEEKLVFLCLIPHKK